MFALRATYLFAAAGIAFASPAVADNADARRSPTASSSAARFNFSGLGQHGASQAFQRLRRSELDRGHGYGRGPGRPGRPGKPGQGHGNGHGNGHGPKPCGGDYRCHASPG